MDERDLTIQKMLPELKSFKKHTLFFPDKKYKHNQYDAFVSHRYSQNSVYHNLGIDSYGFIHNGDEMRQPFVDDEKIKVVLLGGSSQAGLGAASNRNTISSYLERQLNNNNLNIEYEVINAGKSSYLSTLELSYFVIELVNYKPDFVVALDGYNDFWLSVAQAKESASYEGWAIPQRTRYSRSIEDFVNKPSLGKSLAALDYDKFKRVFYFASRLVAGVQAERSRTREEKLEKSPQGKSVWVDNAIYIRDKINHTYSHIPFMEKNWRSLIGAAIANNVKPIILLQPVLPITEKKMTESETKAYNAARNYRYVSQEDFEKYARVFFNEASKMVERVKTSFPNAEEAIIEDISKMFIDESESVFIDPVHYTHYGNCKLAQLIASKIRNKSREFVDTLCVPDTRFK